MSSAMFAISTLPLASSMILQQGPVAVTKDFILATAWGQIRLPTLCIAYLDLGKVSSHTESVLSSRQPDLNL